MITLILDHAYCRMWSLKGVFNSLGNHVPTLATSLNLKRRKYRLWVMVLNFTLVLQICAFSYGSLKIVKP